MRLPRFCLTLALAMSCAPAAADDFPAKPLRLITIFAAGAAADQHACYLATKFSEQLSQRVLVDNRPGAGGIVSTREAFAKVAATPEMRSVVEGQAYEPWLGTIKQFVAGLNSEAVQLAEDYKRLDLQAVD